MQRRLVFETLLPLGILFSITFTAARAQPATPISVVSPSEAANFEGNRSVSGGRAVRSQSIYPAADFESLPESQRTMIGVAYRPDAENDFTAPITGPVVVRLATTETDELETTYEENFSDSNVTTVFDGIVTWQTSDEPNDPHDFDFEIRFQDPFLYDPSQGNLILDFFVPSDMSPVGDWKLDSWPPPHGAVTVAGPPSSPSGTYRDGIWPAEFTFMPLPWLGDANFDGEFNSSDLTAVFQVGEYEDEMTMNSTWTDGDWNGDREFDTGDLVAAFQDGGYELGPRAVVSAVPEPSSILLLVTAVLAIGRCPENRGGSELRR